MQSVLTYKTVHWSAAPGRGLLLILPTASTPNINLFFLCSTVHLVSPCAFQSWWKYTYKRDTNSFGRHKKVHRCDTQCEGCLCLTQTNGKMAFSPDSEIKEQVLVELLQKWAVAFIENLLQQHLTCHQNIHVHHAAWNLQHRKQRGGQWKSVCV